MATRLTLSDGKWIDVKEKLKVRDKRAVQAFSTDGVSSDGKTYRFSIANHQVANAAVRILNWAGFVGDNGKPFPYAPGKSFEERVAVLDQLDEDDFEEITEAINREFEPKTDAAKDDKSDQVAEKKDEASGETS